MIIDPKQKSGRFIMMAIEEKIAALEAVTCDPKSNENEVSDASNDMGLYRGMLQEMIEERDGEDASQPEWIMKGKSITQLIMELGSFEDQNLEVRLTFDGGHYHRPISILTRRDGYAMLEYCGW